MVSQVVDGAYWNDHSEEYRVVLTAALLGKSLEELNRRKQSHKGDYSR